MPRPGRAVTACFASVALPWITGGDALADRLKEVERRLAVQSLQWAMDHATEGEFWFHVVGASSPVSSSAFVKHTLKSIMQGQAACLSDMWGIGNGASMPTEEQRQALHAALITQLHLLTGEKLCIVKLDNPITVNNNETFTYGVRRA